MFLTHLHTAVLQSGRCARERQWACRWGAGAGPLHRLCGAACAGPPVAEGLQVRGMPHCVQLSWLALTALAVSMCSMCWLTCGREAIGYYSVIGEAIGYYSISGEHVQHVLAHLWQRGYRCAAAHVLLGLARMVSH